MLSQKRNRLFPKKMVHGLQKVKYIVLALILLSCLTGVYGKLTEPARGMFFHAHGRTAPEQQISGGNCVPGADHCGNVYTGKVFLPVSLSHGSGFALMPILPGALFRRTSEKCPPKCGLCKKMSGSSGYRRRHRQIRRMSLLPRMPQHAREKYSHWNN